MSVVASLTCTVLLLTLSGCTTLAPQNLSGSWVLKSSDGQTTPMKLQGLGDDQFYLHGKSLPINGVYLLRDDVLEMMRPNDPRLKDYRWRVEDVDHLRLINEPSVSLTGIRYLGFTLEKRFSPDSNSVSNREARSPVAEAD